METIIEKERRWLLKRIPREILDGDVGYDEYEIEQFYTKDGWRYRTTYNESSGDSTFEKLKKVPIGVGINHEIQLMEIESKEYTEMRKGDVGVITKQRYVININEMKIEIDEFFGNRLVIMEIEGVDMEDKIEFPDWIKQLILLEITGNPDFSNYSLAEKEKK